jgi:lipoyl-dependent peroxiredoxin subunit D
MTATTATTLEALRARIPDSARDTKLNLQGVLQQSTSTLSPAQRWGVAVASAVAARHRELRDAVVAEARREGIAAAVIEDALAAASLMAMNNVYYRFRHLVEKPVYGEKPARLRMNRLVKPAGAKVDFELFALAVSAINGCGTCMASHEQVVTGGGLTTDQVHDAIRIAATINAAALALEIAEIPREATTPGEDAA